MLDALRFVASAVARKDYVPELTHFKIRDGRVTGFNGRMALSSPIDVDLNVLPHATALINAVRACPDVISLNVTPASRLAVKSHPFKAFVPCLPADAPALWVEPEGEEIDLGSGFLAGLQVLAPLMGTDASRPWAMGVKLTRQMMYATNNVMLAAYWHGEDIPLDVVIPASAVEELLRIDATPTRIQLTDTSISFWFEGNRWLRSQLVESSPWPVAKIDELMNREPNAWSELPVGFDDVLTSLKPFLGEREVLYLTANAIATSQHDGDGAVIDMEIPGVTQLQAYHIQHLKILAEVAQKVDWSFYPTPCMFKGRNERMRGAMVGQRITNE